MDWAGEKNICSVYACPALRLLGTPRLPTRLETPSPRTQPDKKLRGLGGTCQAQSSNATPCKNHVMPCKNRAKRVGRQKPCKKSSQPYGHRSGECARPSKKNWPRKKRMASWARQRQQITEDADGGARARTGADGAVALNLRRGPGPYALLSRADGQLTRAGQHYYSHLGLRPPSKDFDYNQPLIREGPNDYILLRNGQKQLVRSLQGGEHRLTRLGKGFFRDKYYEYLVHVPAIIRARRSGERRRGLRAQGLAAGERAGRRHDEAPGPPHGGAGGAAGQATSGGLARGAAPSCSSRTRPTSLTLRGTGQHPEQDRGGDAPAPAHEGPEERELPAALQRTCCRAPSRTSRSACRQLAELLQLSVEEVCADFDAMLRHDWRRLGISAEEVREFCVWRNAPMRVLSSATSWTATTRR